METSNLLKLLVFLLGFIYSYNVILSEKGGNDQ